MSYLTEFVKGVAGRLTGKSYSGLLSGGLPSGSIWGSNDYLKALDISLYTDRAIAKRAEKVGEIEWVVKDRLGNPIEGHKILDVLNYPNDLFSGPKFWSLAQIYYDVVGSAYIVKDIGRELFESTKVKQLHLLRPDLVTPIFSADKSSVSHYEYRGGNGQTVRYEADQVIWIYNPDPKNPLTGRSLLKAGLQEIQTGVQISAYHSRVLENGGKVEGVFKFKTPRLTEVQLKQLKDDYQKNYADARKSGTPLFLGGDAEYVKTGLSPEELSYLEAKKMTLEDIIIMTGVPKVLLGSADEIQYSNAEGLYRIFLRETVKPLLNNLATALDRTLVPEGEKLTFIDPTPENVEEKIKETEAGIKNYFMTINEARTRHGLEEVSDGDVIMVPFSLIPLGDTSLLTSDKTESKKNKQVKSTEELEHPLRNKEMRKKYGQKRAKKEDRQIFAFRKIVNKYFEEQRDRVISSLSPQKAHSFKRKGLVDEVFNIEIEAKIAKASFMPKLIEMLAEAGGEAMVLAGSEYSFNLTSTITSWMDKRAETAAASINKTTHKQLTKQFEESLAQGETRDQLIDRVRTVYDNNISIGRAATIARTEVHNANQYGTIEGYRQGNMPIKIWVSVVDADTRGADIHDEANHIEMDGEERPLDMPFSNGLMYPGDPRGGAAEVINCRCQI